MTAIVERGEDNHSRRLVLGKGRYVDDIKMEGMLHLHVVRSPYARARVLSVKGGMTGHELKADLASVGEGAGGKATIPFPVLATDYVSYVGQPVAAVFGEDRYQAEDKADEVDVQYEPLKAVIDPELSLDSEPIHPSASSNLTTEITLGKPFDMKAAIEIEDTLQMARITPNPIETRGAVASYDGSLLTVYGSTQSVFSWREGISSSLGLDEGKVRVVQMDTGGAFGSKGGIYPEYVIAAYAAMKLRRPVKWIENRYEHLMATDQGRGVRAKMKLYADSQGRISGLQADLLVDSGAFSVGSGAWAPRSITTQLTGMYSIRKAYAKARSVYTNKVCLGPYRGAGRPEAAFFMERMMDRLAEETGLDYAEVRLRNTSSRPFESPFGMKIAPSKPFLREAVSALGYSRRKKGGNVGLSCFVLVPATWDGESTKLAVRGGRVKVWMGGSSSGQGHDIFARSLIAQELGVDEEVVDFEGADTAELSGGVGTWGSRTAMMGGGALVEASRKLKANAKKKLGKRYSVRALLQGEFEAEVFFKPSGPLISFGANLVTSKINRLGMAAIDEVVSYYDVGNPLNPSMIEGQIVGGSAQGLGEVLFERALYNEDGQLLTASIADAGVPHSTEMPKFVAMTAAHKSYLPHGSKGVGESPTIGVPPAATRALESILGRRFTRLPIEPESLWAERRGARVPASARGTRRTS